jgi:hypothetical protein
MALFEVAQIVAMLLAKGHCHRSQGRRPWNTQQNIATSKRTQRVTNFHAKR